MSREWKPGDVATFAGETVIYTGDDEWRWAATGFALVGQREADLEARPLVVIDPEDREQVERLLASLQDMSFAAHACGAFTCLQAALREFANPTPPKPDEPMGRYAVVVDANGDEWIRTAEAPPAPWLRSGWFTAEEWTDYADISAVRVLSEGVTNASA